MKRLSLFLAFILYKSTIGVNLLVTDPSPVQKSFTKFICKITGDIIKSHNHTQDVFLGYSGKKTGTSTVINVAECLSDVSPVVITDLQESLTEKNLRKATVIILEFETVSAVNEP